LEKINSTKICLMPDDYMPNSIKVAAKITYALARDFIKQGHQVSVVTPNAKYDKSFSF